MLLCPNNVLNFNTNVGIADPSKYMLYFDADLCHECLLWCERTQREIALEQVKIFNFFYVILIILHFIYSYLYVVYRCEYILAVN